jgi:hypothetical protein
MVGVTSCKNLRLRFQAPERSGVNDAVAVTLKVITIGMAGFWEPASAGLSDVHRVGGEHGKRIEESREIW